MQHPPGVGGRCGDAAFGNDSQPQDSYPVAPDQEKDAGLVGDNRLPELASEVRRHVDGARAAARTKVEHAIAAGTALERTSEIPKLDKTIGADGKTRPAKKPKPEPVQDKPVNTTIDQPVTDTMAAVLVEAERKNKDRRKQRANFNHYIATITVASFSDWIDVPALSAEEAGNLLCDLEKAVEGLQSLIGRVRSRVDGDAA